MEPGHLGDRILDFFPGGGVDLMATATMHVDVYEPGCEQHVAEVDDRVRAARGRPGAHLTDGGALHDQEGVIQ
jgi:hypothetical protein